jgi:hypothetical protein
MADFLATAQGMGMTTERFLSTLIGEQLYDVWREARRQHRLNQQPKPQRQPVTGDVDDGIPF